MQEDNDWRQPRLAGGITAFVAAAASALLAACTSLGPPTTEGWTPPPAGTTWEIAQRNTGSYGPDAQFTVTYDERLWEGVPAVVFTNSRGMGTVADLRTGRWLAQLGPNGRPAVSFSPALGWEYPLHKGKAWTTRYRMTVHATGRVIDYDLACKVEDWEKVAVRAGTFDAWRIACKASLGTDEVYWMSPSLGIFVKTRLSRDAGNPFGAGTQESELVMAPMLH